MSKYLDIQHLIFPVLVYLFVSIFKLSYMVDILRNLGFIVIIVIVIVKPILNSFGELKEKRFLSHYFLYFSSVILLLVNFLLVIFHGLLAFSFDAFSGTGDIKILNLLSNFYHITFYLDILGFSLLLSYFYFLKPNESKLNYRTTGLIGSGLFVVFSIIWRFQSNFITAQEYSFWISQELKPSIFLLIAVSQIALCTTYFSLYYLNKLSPITQQKLLDNQFINGTQISRKAYYVGISFIILLISLPILYNHVVPPYSLLILAILLLKMLIIPVLMLMFNLNIFQQYNLTF